MDEDILDWVNPILDAKIAEAKAFLEAEAAAEAPVEPVTEPVVAETDPVEPVLVPVLPE